MSHRHGGSGHPPEQWQSLLPQTFPANAPGHGGDEALLLQTAAEQRAQLTPLRVLMSWDMQGWDQQRWEDRVSFCSTTCAGREEAIRPWGDGKVGLLLCSRQMAFSYYFSIQEKETHAGMAEGGPRHVP